MHEDDPATSEPADEGPSFEEVLAERCPSMRPMRGKPPLFTINGFGVSLYGDRDRDPVTGTFVKTLFLTGLFVPVLALSSYRVANAPTGGWYFLGKEPLSPLAKGWTFLVLACALSVGGWAAWEVHTSSPEYRARQALAQAQALLAEGSRLEAAQQFARLRGTLEAKAGLEGLQALFAAEPEGTLSDAAQVVGAAAGWTDALADDQVVRLAGVAVERAAQDPDGALLLISALPQDAAPVEEAREPVYLALHQANPENPEVASQLALLYEARGELERCEAVLLPCAAGLRGHEGARILGQILTQRGEVEEAQRLLEPYVEARLDELHQSEAAYTAAQQQAWDAELESLRQGSAGQAWYARYDAATEEEQGTMVQEWVGPRLANSPQLGAVRARLERAASIVPVALDLGIVKLQRAQGLEDAEARTRELEGAERVFLAVQGVASDSPLFQLHLATVYYWLGKHDEGHTLFEELLETTERDPQVLLRVATELRGVGAQGEARVLAEEAYEAGDEDVQQEAAGLCAVLATDLDEEVAWLERCDTSHLFTQAQLRAAQGDQAQAKGDEALAEARFREALEAYGKLTPTSSSLNNAALIYQRLHALRSKPEDFRKSVDMLEEAERLDSKDPILLYNLSNGLLDRAGLAAIGDHLELETLRSGPDLAQLTYLFRTAAEREAVYGRLIAHPDFSGGVERFNKLLVLSPQNVSVYHSLLDAYGYSYGLAEHQALEAVLASVELDHSDYAAFHAQWLAGDDPEEAADMAAARQRSRERAAEVLATARASEHPATVAAALLELAQVLLGGHAFKEEVPYDRVVSLTEEAHALHPSRASSNMLLSACLARAQARLAAAHPEFAGLVEHHRRSVSIWTLPLLALEHEHLELRQAAQLDPDVARAAKLVVELGRADPRTLSGWDWALLRGVGSPHLEQVERALRENEVLPVRQRLKIAVEPLGTNAVLAHAWYLRALGDDAAAEACLQAAAERGVRLP